MGIYVPCESADHLRVRCFAVLRSALLCASTLCYAESNDHWSLRVCPIPNLNLIPVVRLLARPALVMTLDWLLWAAHTISIGGVPALQHLYSRGGEAGPSRVLHERRRRRRGEAARVELHIAPLHVAQSACAPANSTARKGWRELGEISKPQLL